MPKCFKSAAKENTQTKPFSCLFRPLSSAIANTYTLEFTLVVLATQPHLCKTTVHASMHDVFLKGIPIGLHFSIGSYSAIFTLFTFCIYPVDE